MIRLLMAGTALAAVLATGALAQSSSSAMDTSSSSMASSAATDSSSASAATSTAPSQTSSSASTATDQTSSAATDQTSSQAGTSSAAATTTTANPQFTILSGYTQVSTDRLASTVIGAHVYDGTAQNANDLGKINDLVLNQNGSIAAVVVGVGGFLGLGEKQVAVDYHALQWEVGPDNNRRFVLQTTKDELTSAPDFKTVSPDQASGASGGASGAAPASGADANSNAMSSSSAQ